MITERIPELKDLTLEDKLQLIGELWEDIGSSQDQLGIDAEVVKLLDQRFAAYRDDPASALSWDEFRRSIGKA